MTIAPKHSICPAASSRPTGLPVLLLYTGQDMLSDETGDRKLAPADAGGRLREVLYSMHLCLRGTILVSYGPWEANLPP